MLKAIIFDFDYTLGDSTNGIALSINYALEHLGHTQKSLDQIKRTIGLSLKDTYYQLTSDNQPDNAIEFAALFKEKADIVMVDNTELYEGVKLGLEKLKAEGYMTAIVTTKFHYRINQILKKHSANELIDMIVGAEDVKIEKPNPEGLLWTIDHLGVKKQEVLYVGDSLIDAETAERAEVRFAAVLTGTTKKAEFEECRNAYIGKHVVNVFQYISEYGHSDKSLL